MARCRTSRRWPHRRAHLFVEEFSQFLGHGAGKFFGVDDRHCSSIITGHVMTNADSDEFDR
jgi:hypothetical protein